MTPVSQVLASLFCSVMFSWKQEIIFISCLFFYILAAPLTMWDPSSPTRGHTCPPCIGVLTPGLPGKSPE